MTWGVSLSGREGYKVIYTMLKGQYVSNWYNLRCGMMIALTELIPMLIPDVVWEPVTMSARGTNWDYPISRTDIAWPNSCPLFYVYANSHTSEWDDARTGS